MCQALLRAAQDFCTRTQLVTSTVNVGRTRAGVARYALPVPQGLEVTRLLSVWVGSTPLQLAAAHEIDTPEMFTGVGGPLGYPKFAALAEGGTGAVVLGPAAAKEGLAVKARVALTPTHLEAVPSQLMTPPWMDTWVAGARHIVQMVPGQVFSNPEMAAQAKAEFELGVLRAKAHAVRGPVQASMRVKAHPMV